MDRDAAAPAPFAILHLRFPGLCADTIDHEGMPNLKNSAFGYVGRYVPPQRCFSVGPQSLDFHSIRTSFAKGT